MKLTRSSTTNNSTSSKLSNLKKSVKEDSRSSKNSQKVKSALPKKLLKDVTQQQPEVSSVTSGTRKRKRPWRQAIRHKAKRERLTEEVSEVSFGDSLEQEDFSEDNSHSGKKNKRSRKKRIRDKNKILAKCVDTNTIDEQDKDKTQHFNSADARLDAARFRYVNEQLYTHPSTSAVQLFKEDPNAFEAYHRGYKQQLKKWPFNPLNSILLDISSLPPGSVIADLGCGEAELAERLGSKYKVHSFDLVSLNERVVVADMAKLPLARNSVDVCVYCLSLMGTNLAHFFREAHRILKMNGKVKIVEVGSRFKNIKKFIAALGKMGFQLKRKKELDNGYFTALTLQKIGKFVNKRPLGLQLDPCLYKKR
uniref:Ribosomal RNA-processing protein 8 n=1 Tax=Meloidogyne hapla TaxID=6305 RepID=A0A1I8BXK0_MELHA